MYDDGLNPKDADADELAMNAVSVRRELGIIMYASNVLGSRGPRKMKVYTHTHTYTHIASSNIVQLFHRKLIEHHISV